MTTHTTPDLLNAEEVCQLLQIGPKTLKRLIDEHGLPVFVFGHASTGRGRRRRFDRAAVLAWYADYLGARAAKGKGRAKPTKASAKTTVETGHRGGGAVRTESEWRL